MIQKILNTMFGINPTNGDSSGIVQNYLSFQRGPPVLINREQFVLARLNSQSAEMLTETVRTNYI
jgi:hypothetical protein